MAEKQANLLVIQKSEFESLNLRFKGKDIIIMAM